MKLATWNVNSLRARLDHVVDWLDAARPDVLALQETKVIDEKFPVAELAEVGYRATFTGQKTYNGVAVLAREEPTDVVAGLPGTNPEEKRFLAATIGGVRVIDVYVVNGGTVDSDRYFDKLEWLGALAAFVEKELVRHPELIVLGDFNVTPEDRDVHDPEAWRGQILCSEPERAALRRVLDVGLVDVFRTFDQPERSFSWWDYRAGGFRRNRGLRIDLVLASPAIVERAVGCTIDKRPRGRERPSDHTPVVLELR